jgi:hypothetical protein
MSRSCPPRPGRPAAVRNPPRNGGTYFVAPDGNRIHLSSVSLNTPPFCQISSALPTWSSLPGYSSAAVAVQTHCPVPHPKRCCGPNTSLPPLWINPYEGWPSTAETPCDAEKSAANHGQWLGHPRTKLISSIEPTGTSGRTALAAGCSIPHSQRDWIDRW